MTVYNAAINEALNLEHSFNVSRVADYPSIYAVSTLATAVTGAVGGAVSQLLCDLNLIASNPSVTVDQTLASRWFAQSIHPIDWKLPPIWDALAGDYRTRDGWIRLHTNMPHHRAAVLEAVGCEPERDQLSAAIRHYESSELEARVVQFGGAAAALRSRSEWLQHPQGMAVAQEPLIAWQNVASRQPADWYATRQRPLNGLRVLDMTRVLAGPVATRTLAGLGADVLRVDPPGFDESVVVPDVTLGKRCSRLDLEEDRDRDQFEKLLSEAHVLVHGYRPGALDGLGLNEQHRRHVAPDLIEVSLDAYGWSGPWAERRGFDSLVQMSCGIAHAGMISMGQNAPVPLPVQALDHATGYLMAAAVLRALSYRVRDQVASCARLSLARTASLLMDQPQPESGGVLTATPESDDVSSAVETTPWGTAHRLKPALAIDGTPMSWDRPACNLGSSAACWH